MPERIFGADTSRRHNLTFWVAHIVDSEFSALMGSTASIQNEQITAKLPNVTSDSLEASTMSLHVRLSRLMSTILTSKYYATLAQFSRIVYIPCFFFSCLWGWQ